VRCGTEFAINEMHAQRTASTKVIRWVMMHTYTMQA
jgi:hypothetical protein